MYLMLNHNSQHRNKEFVEFALKNDEFTWRTTELITSAYLTAKFKDTHRAGAIA